MHIGFTGTRIGMTPAQQRQVREWLHERSIHEGATFHHGDCIGADVEAALMARELGYRIVCHPPSDKSLRGFGPADEMRPPRQYLLRNRDIVMACTLLIAAPRHMDDATGGTWYTIRYAGRDGVPVKIARP